MIKQQRREIIAFFEKRREERTKRAVLDDLRVETSEVDGAAVYLSKLVWSWLKVARKLRLCKHNHEVVAENHRNLLKVGTLRVWKESVYVSFAENRVALPFSETKLLEKVFHAFKQHVE